MAMAAAGDVTTVQVEEDPEPTQADEPSTETSGEPADIQKDLDRLLLTKIANNSRSLFGIVVSKYYTEDDSNNSNNTENDEIKKLFFGAIDVDRPDCYEAKFRRLMKRLEDAAIQDPEGFVIEKERKNIQLHLKVLDRDIETEDFESSIVYKTAMQSFHVAEMSLAARHQLLVCKNVSLDTLKKKVEDLGILTRNDSNASVNKLPSYLRHIIKAEKLSTEVEREVEDTGKYIEAYNSLLKEFFYNHLRDLKALDESKRDLFLKVEETHKFVKSVLEDSSRRRTQVEQTGESDNKVSLKRQKFWLQIYDKGGMLNPQIFAEQIVGLAYAKHIDQKIQRELQQQLFKNGIIYPATSLANSMQVKAFNKHQPKHFSAGSKLFSTLVFNLYSIIRGYWALQQHGCTPSQADSWYNGIVHSLYAINRAIEEYRKTKTSDRRSTFYEDQRKAFQTLQPTLSRNNLHDTLPNVISSGNMLRIAAIHETLVTTDMTMASWYLLEYLSEHHKRGNELERTAETVQNQVNRVKHQLDPLVDMVKYNDCVKYIISEVTDNQREAFREEWCIQTLEKYVEEFEAGRTCIIDHTTKCPGRDEYLKQVVGELEDVKGKLAEANGKLAEANEELANRRLAEINIAPK